MRGRWGGRLAYLLAVTLVVAGLTHLTAVLVLPGRSAASAYASFAAALAGTTLRTMVRPQAVPFADPALPGAVCLYDLRQGPVSASLAVAEDAFVVLSVHDRHGRVLAGLTTRSAREGRLGLTVAAAGEGTVRRPDDAAARGDIRVEAAEPEGFVLAEALARAPSEQASAEATASGLSCRPARP